MIGISDADLARERVDGGGVDPEVASFVGQLATDYARHGAGAVSPPERRAVAERVRTPWRSGGPVMAERRDHMLDGIRLRLHRPSADPDLPVMLYVHGGGWTLFSIDTHDRLMREYAARAGIAVVGIDYSLSPESRFPVALDEIGRTLNWLEGEGAAGWRLDPSQVFVGGDSAGANLAVGACLRRRDAGLPRLAGMVLNYGVYSADETESFLRYAGPQHNLEVAEMREFWTNYLADPTDRTSPLAAPLQAELHDLPPAVMAIAECDILADGNHAFAAKLAAAGVPVDARVYTGATHSFLEAVSIAKIAGRAFDEQAAWLRARIAQLDAGQARP